MTPRSVPAGFRAKAGGVEVGVGKLGFSVQESVIVVLGQVHLLLSPEVREGAPEIQSLWIPEMLSLGGGGALPGSVTPYWNEVG